MPPLTPPPASRVVAALAAALFLSGCSSAPDGPTGAAPAPELGLAECFAVQQLSFELSPSSSDVAPARLDAGAGVGFTRDAMCLDLAVGSLETGWTLQETRVRVERANRQDAWAGAAFERVLPGGASDEGADTALPLVVPFNYQRGFAGCFRITLEASVSRGPLEGTWAATGRRGICPGTRFTRATLEELAG